ncbi:hypothetical protein K9N68_07895 [Kovacikia minuta CCNUW1]|uniref:hypothetical protein n=1 Tax=Kovacikia minuta TaxID=2931930 RepID=UPI001CC8FC18|nr:hypothetical protein [Kovacikia minuta]UBF27821.1 hypothetical protein K9N68_07895 [Kovacikia minuta CCNUW1]
MMKAYEFSTNISPDGKLNLPDHLKGLANVSEVRVILLVEETPEETETANDDEENEGFSAASFHESWHQAVKGQTLPLSQLWEGIHVD